MLTVQQLVIGAYVTHKSFAQIQKIININQNNEAILNDAMLYPLDELKLIEVNQKISCENLNSKFTVIGFNNWYLEKKEDALIVKQNNEYGREYRITNFKSKCYPLVDN